MEDKARFSTSIELATYVSFACENGNNYDSDQSNDNNVRVEVEKNDDHETMGGGPPDNLYKLYGTYNRQYALQSQYNYRKQPNNSTVQIDITPLMLNLGGVMVQLGPNLAIANTTLI